MKRSNRILILFGVFLAVIAFTGVVLLSANKTGGNGPSATASATPEPTTTVVFAKTSIAMGDKITGDMVDVKTLKLSERDALAPGTFTFVNEVIGKTAGAPIEEGAFLYSDQDFNAPGTVKLGTDLAPTVTSGMRGISMEVDQVNGVGTLVVPGDRVDVILSVWMDQVGLDNVQSGKTGVKVAASSQVTTKLVIQNRKILATLLPAQGDTSTPSNPSPSASAKPSSQTVTLNNNHMLVILEVSPQEAEVIRWAQREEKQDPQNYITLSLALRSDKDNDKVTTQGITFRQLVVFYQVMPPDPRGIIPADILSKISW